MPAAAAAAAWRNRREQRPPLPGQAAGSQRQRVRQKVLVKREAGIACEATQLCKVADRIMAPAATAGTETSIRHSCHGGARPGCEVLSSVVPGSGGNLAASMTPSKSGGGGEAVSASSSACSGKMPV